jgi:hypothetical protein
MYRTRNLRITFSQSSACFSGLEERMVSSAKLPALVLLLWQPMQYRFTNAGTGEAAVDGCCAQSAPVVPPAINGAAMASDTYAQLRVKSLLSTNYDCPRTMNSIRGREGRHWARFHLISRHALCERSQSDGAIRRLGRP